MSLLQDVWSRIIGTVPTGATADADGSLAQQMRYVAQNVPVIGVMYKVGGQGIRTASSLGAARTDDLLLVGVSGISTGTPQLSYGPGTPGNIIFTTTITGGGIFNYFFTIPIAFPRSINQSLHISGGIAHVYYMREQDLQVINP